MINILRKLPIRWQRKLRRWAQMLEHKSQELVVPDDFLPALIENCQSPDYEKHDTELAKIQSRWEIYDVEIERLKVARRWAAFKRKNKSITEEQP